MEVTFSPLPRRDLQGKFFHQAPGLTMPRAGLSLPCPATSASSPKQDPLTDENPAATRDLCTAAQNRDAHAAGMGLFSLYTHPLDEPDLN